MLFNKSIFVIAIVALANVVIAVQTPACVLKVIGQQPNPADSKAICGSNASKIQSTISKNCADSEASLKFFANNCAQLGHKVETNVSTATGASETSTATGFVTATQTGSSAVATGTGTGAAAVSTGTASESGAAASPTSTFNAASSDRQLSTTFVAAVFLGAAALL
ncbi:hypothetical protein N7519_009749 [Penicillium mononematosum]|uniref:uncharacterized protein n=1 Tax=Penicillium mononematosum TaxID=268346 RepID=UPI0025483C94|nr:uncharacterized protein N7519_009749 [Penicillium mononematosum]KAJ6179288.1 hypothetical protein N7519_009749 [Penicillium mononematosum]